MGSPLPETGVCAHHRHSHRWLRFPCCGRLFPCDECHEAAAAASAADGGGGGGRGKCAVGMRATRMVCGFCSTEQAGGYCATEKCVNAECGKRLEGGGGAGQARGEAQLWEGGQQGASHGSFSNKNDLRKWKKDQVKEQQGLEKVGSSIAVGVFA